ncbi:Anaerobic glycerol-3-phosphate dehydrogenase subunit C [Symmachiella macrocystis]|uniref:Anaerobic glycerol-3-phosphate dehydrogenase subunit C n=1 Tax=Symmachiella macrocystis TaxID=2527985 RepID=A0A5C6BP03_9PLAN|nr:FAD-binding and (Fe-S)-binding domain-containing protein [Symmachiella macrocystis]TWU12314.1 Anaerobic glycerol-3-phosphate dehydrogenase subunit C [Symmachiella macrocystis]
MDELRTRISEDLSGVLKGEIRCDSLTVAMYSDDASLYQIPPAGVAYPRDQEDVVTLAKYSASTDTPLVARGAGTGLAGESLGRGIVVDFSRHMRHIEIIDDESVRVQPGVVCSMLNRELRKNGRYFPPDPSGAGVTTIGSMLALDAAGSHSVRIGSTRDHVRQLEVVLSGGHVVELGQEPLTKLTGQPYAPAPFHSSQSPAGLDSGSDAPTVKRTLISKLAKLLDDNSELIRIHQPPLIRNRSGYYLRGVLTPSHLNMARMLVGSEGTLGLFTAATLHTSPLPAHRGAVLIVFGQLESALRAVQAVAPQQPSACDLLDRRVLSLARDSHPRFADMIPTTGEAALLVEQTGFTSRQIRDRIRMVISTVHDLSGVNVVTHEAYEPDEVEFLWSLPERVVPLLMRLPGPTHPLPFVEDVAVPPEALPDFLVRAQNVFKKHEVTSSLYAHAAAGQLHMRPFLTQPTAADAHRLEEIARDLYQVVFSVGGTISGEHGDGLSRTSFLRSQYGALYAVFKQIKQIFDPHNIMNPGKIISDDPHLTIKNLRPPTQPPEDLVPLQMNWNWEQVAEEAVRCNGCGSCRTQDADQRMCPLFRTSHLEEASPRAKANLMRQIAAGTLDADLLASADFKRVADLCFNCKQCELECPTNVNIPHLMVEAKAAHVASNGLSRTEWYLSRVHLFGGIIGAASLAINWAIQNPLSRWAAERMFGIARQRKLPLFARRPFLKSHKALTRNPSRSGKSRGVVYFVDHYANLHDPELGKAFVAILRHNGIPVHAPAGQQISGMALISTGDLDAARDIAKDNIRELAEFAREEIPIVCTEPTAALCLKREYPALLDHPDLELISEQTTEAGQFLANLHAEGRLKVDFEPLDLTVGYHTPCHLKALGDRTPLADLLELIPGLKLRKIEQGCSGMAGTFGLSTQNFRESLRIGWGLITQLREDSLDIGATECSSCKMQMEQGARIPTLHPIKLLALSYGLMPELREKLKPPQKPLVVT